MSGAANGPEPDRVLHVSDVHFGVEDPQALDAFEQAIVQCGAEAVICTGDITQRATHAQWEAARRWFAGLSVPVMAMPGNHDMPYGNLLERFMTPFKRFEALAGVVSAELSLRHAIVIPFDTNVPAQARWPWSDGVVRQSRLEPTLERLAQLSGDPRRKIVACHHPLLPARDGLPNPTIRGDEAFAQLVAAGADCILSGHVHVLFDQHRTRGGHCARMIGAGTLSTRLRGAPPGWNLLTFDAAAIHCRSMCSQPA